MRFMAGPKLREQAIKCTQEHILRNQNGKTELAKALAHTTYEYNLAQYLEEEKRRLMKLRGGL